MTRSRSKAEIALARFLKLHPGTVEIKDFVRLISKEPSGEWYLAALSHSLAEVLAETTEEGE